MAPVSRELDTPPAHAAEHWPVSLGPAERHVQQPLAGGSDASSHRRSALAAQREAPQMIAEVMAREARTGIRAAGAAINSFGMSPYEVAGGPHNGSV